ncbi:hypothetical protein BH10ACT3_BH10ACT3_19600 [soil metagenome]
MYGQRRGYRGDVALSSIGTKTPGIKDDRAGT